MPKWAIMRALEQAAIARRERDYTRAMKWLSYARAFRHEAATGPVVPYPTVEQCVTAYDRRVRTARKILRHGMMYSMSTGAFFNMLLSGDKK